MSVQKAQNPEVAEVLKKEENKLRKYLSECYSQRKRNTEDSKKAK